MITYKDVKKNEEIRLMIERGNQVLKELGYTEHSRKHAVKVAETAGNLLKDMGYGEKEVELSRIAGYMHDIGNGINRHDHAHTGAVLAYQILKELGMPLEDAMVVATAIGHHDENTAAAVSPIASALILSDKSDVRRTRVRNKNTVSNDIHDRVNYAVEEAVLQVQTEEKTITLQITIDTAICPVMEYFEIFLSRMVLCRKAAACLDLTFELVINGTRLL